LREAAFVICNPSHVAVALAYRPPEIAVPKVVVRAIDAGALEVKRRARALRVPIVEDVALARLLLAASDVDEYIPPRAYAAVAAIVASLLRERSRA
jgi:flagellar biosynthetic protein FlhB